eukprot:SAG11_NODE_13323_length_660_cov_0.850267_1_plen_110_part_00
MGLEDVHLHASCRVSGLVLPPACAVGGTFLRGRPHLEPFYSGTGQIGARRGAICGGGEWWARGKLWRRGDTCRATRREMGGQVSADVPYLHGGRDTCSMMTSWGLIERT